MSEYSLIKALGAASISPFCTADLAEPLDLFRCHFLLFHVLYQLRDRFLLERRGLLCISPAGIVLVPYEPGSPALTEADPLRDYYLDRSHLTATTREDVRALLDRFWRRFDAHDHRAEALAALGLEDPVDDRAIRDRYRREVARHHPDRGGSKERLQAINRAMGILKRGRP